MQPRRLLPRIVVAMALLQPLAAVAVGTWLLSRHWAFQGRPAASR